MDRLLLSKHTGTETVPIGWKLPSRPASEDIEPVLEASKYPIGAVLKAELKADPADACFREE